MQMTLLIADNKKEFVKCGKFLQQAKTKEQRPQSI